MKPQNVYFPLKFHKRKSPVKLLISEEGCWIIFWRDLCLVDCKSESRAEEKMFK